MKWFKLSFVLLGAYVVALLLTLPAAHVYSWVKPKKASLYEMDGTPWSGQAKVAILQGYRLENIHWHLKLWPLLLGRLQYGLKIPFGNDKVNIAIGKGITGSFYFDGINGKIPLKELLKLGNIRFVDGEGNIHLKDVNLQVSDEGIRYASGQVSWKDAKFTLLQPIDLKEINIKLDVDDRKLKAIVTSSTQSTIDISGTLHLSMDGKYTFDGKLAERKNIGLKDLIQNRYRKGRDGKYIIKYNGRLPI